MKIEITARKLRKPAPVRPEALYIAHMRITEDDGQMFEEGAWFGVTKQEAIADAQIWANQYIKA